MASRADGATPMRRQYLALKRRHPDAILFFRLGDFYETFDDDARLAARVLNITLTSREVGKGQRVPLAGVPYHSAEGYIARLIAAGHKVAVCEQMDEKGQVRGPNRLVPERVAGGPGATGATGGSSKMMAREVIRVVTPGTVVEPRMLEPRRNNYLCAVVAAYAANGDPRFGLAHTDVTTGGFAVAELDGPEATDDLARELERLAPAECLIPAAAGLPVPSGVVSTAQPAEGPPPSPERAACAGRNVTELELWRFELETAQEALCRQFGVTSLAGFGCAHLPLAVRAAGALVAYVEHTNRSLLALLDGLRTYAPGGYVRLDGFTRRNLELAEEAPGKRADPGSTPRPSLLSVLDETRTPMGGRLLRRWLGQPLLDAAALGERHDVVSALHADGVLRGQLRAILQRVADLERLTNRARQGTAQPRELLALRQSLLAAAEASELAHAGGDASAEPERIDALLAKIDPAADVADVIERAVYDATAGGPERRRETLGAWEDERLIKPGYSQELDDLTRSSEDARKWIAGLEAAERERTGIKGLRVGFNRVFGYYLSVSHAYKGEVPAHYIRRQTMTDGERYITPELKEYENLVLHAAERIADLERTLFQQVQRQIADQASRLLATAETLAQLDVLATFAEVAARRGYTRPELLEEPALEIRAGRHPVVEAALEMATTQLGQPSTFVPNDCALRADGDQIIILTGPNMSGKSTFIRSVALIVLLAQAGSFVPAEAARIGLVDRIFTRVGAHDDLAAGQSTFMVEMVETASILRHATRRSLVILDEIGRGTSTYDGVAIAQAVVEYLHDEAGRGVGSPVLSATAAGGSEAVGEGGPRTLFATHYHELAELEQALPRVRNCRVDVLEEGDRVVFLHRVVRGSADRSYGVHVARLAGVPRAVTQRAAEILADLEARRAVVPATHPPGPSPEATGVPAADPASLVAASPPHPVANGQARNGVPAGVVARTSRSRARRQGVLSEGPLEDEVTVLQLSLFGQTPAILEELKALDVMSLTPLQALNLLADLARRAQQA